MTDFLAELPAWVLLVIYPLAVARLTGLVVQDTITEPVRDGLIGWLDDRPKTVGSFIAALVSCVWCSSIWLSGGMAPLIFLWGDEPVMIGLALVAAFSQIAGMIHNLGR